MTVTRRLTGTQPKSPGLASPSRLIQSGSDGHDGASTTSRAPHSRGPAPALYSGPTTSRPRSVPAFTGFVPPVANAHLAQAWPSRHPPITHRCAQPCVQQLFRALDPPRGVRLSSFPRIPGYGRQAAAAGPRERVRMLPRANHSVLTISLDNDRPHLPNSPGL